MQEFKTYVEGEGLTFPVEEASFYEHLSGFLKTAPGITALQSGQLRIVDEKILLVKVVARSNV